MDAWIFLLWLGGAALLGFAMWRLAGHWFPHDSVMSTVMHTLVLCWACIAGVAFLLGTAGLLSGWTLLIGESLAATAILVTPRLHRVPKVDAVAEDEGPWRWCWSMLFCVWFAHSVTSGLLKFPTDWDTLHYHLPIIDHWLQAGSLFAPDCCLWSSPGNSEIVGLWLVAPFSGDFLIGLNNLPIAILLACAAVEVGKNLGLTRSLAHAAGFAVVSNFIVLNQLLDASNDLGVAAAFLACIAYGLRWVKSDACARPNLLLCVTALGLLAGVKFYALGYAAVAAGVLGLLVLARFGWRATCRFSMPAFLGICLFGGYWYVRNYWHTGQPLFPKSYDPDEDLIARIYPDIAHTSFLGNGRPELVELAIKAVWHMAGPCHVVALLAAPAVCVGLLIGARFNRNGGYPGVLGLLLGGAGVVWLITPFAVEDAPGTLNQMHWYYCPVRYGMCFLSLAVLGLAVALQKICSRYVWLSWFPPTFFFTTGMFQTLFPSPRLPIERLEIAILAGNLILLIGTLALVTMLWPGWRRLVVALTFVAVLTGLTWSVDRLARRWHRSFAHFYDQHFAPGLFTTLANRSTSSVCVLDHRAYPFFGSHRQVRVCQPMYVFSPSALMAYLDKHEVSLVVIRPGRRSEGWHLFEHFDECRRTHPHRFRLMDTNGPLVLFAVLHESDTREKKRKE